MSLITCYQNGQILEPLPIGPGLFVGVGLSFFILNTNEKRNGIRYSYFTLKVTQTVEETHSRSYSLV